MRKSTKSKSQNPLLVLFFNKITKRKSIAFILSDFENTNYESVLKTAAKKHDITGIRIYDEKEQEMPNIGLVKMRDLETEKIKWVEKSEEIINIKAYIFRSFCIFIQIFY